MKTDIVISELVKGEKLFSTLHGEVELVESEELDSIYPVVVKRKNGERESFTLEGKFFINDEHPALFKVSPFKEVERIIMVRNHSDYKLQPRILMTIKNNKVLCWDVAQTIEEAKKINTISCWYFWEEVNESPKLVCLTLQDISDGKGVGVDPKLIKIIQ